MLDAFVGRPTIVHAARALDRAAVAKALAPAQATLRDLRRDDDHCWPAPRRLKVAVVLYPGVELLDWAGPAEVFSAHQGFEVYTVALDKKPVSIQRLPSPVTPTYAVADCPAPDVLVVPGGVGANLKPLLPWIEETLAKTPHVLTVCNAALELAERRLLDGLDVTTHHGCLDGLRRRAPTARVHADKRWVDSGRIVTAAGVSAGIDGALRIVERTRGADAARAAARFLQYDAWDPARGLVAAR